MSCVPQLVLDRGVMQATFEDELIEDAKAKRHSLTCEAVEIGSKVSKCCSAVPCLCDGFLCDCFQIVLVLAWRCFDMLSSLAG